MKKTLTAITLAAVLTLGTTFANAGIIITNVSEGPAPTTCADNGKGFYGIIIMNIVGIIIGNRAGIIIGNRGGILVSDAKEQPCTSKSTATGTSIERGGILVSD